MLQKASEILQTLKKNLSLKIWLVKLTYWCNVRSRCDWSAGVIDADHSVIHSAVLGSNNIKVHIHELVSGEVQGSVRDIDQPM